MIWIRALTAQLYGSTKFKVYFSLFSGKTVAFFPLAVDPGKPDTVSLSPHDFEGFRKPGTIYLLSK